MGNSACYNQGYEEEILFGEDLYGFKKKVSLYLLIA